MVQLKVNGANASTAAAPQTEQVALASTATGPRLSNVTLLYNKSGSTIEVNRLDNENDGESNHEKTNLLTASNSSKWPYNN
mgnify:CR=1 FL=1